MKLKRIAFIAALIACFSVTQSVYAIPANTHTTTITAGPFAIGGKTRMVMGQIHMFGNYLTNGVNVTASEFGLVHITSASFAPITGAVAVYVPTTGNFKLYQSAAPNGTISTPTFTGSNATISPSAALAGSPIFTGAGHTASITISGTTSGNAVYFDAGSGTFSAAAGGTVLTEVFTPSGTVSTPAITVTGASYTPAGTVSTPTFTGGASAVFTEMTTGQSINDVLINFVVTGV